jgi:hypothetical protein
MRSPTYAFLSVVIVAGGVLANACSSQPASTGLSQDDQTATDPTTATLPGSSNTSTPAPAASSAPVADPSTADSGVVDPDAGVPVADAAPPPVQQDCSVTTSYDACGQCCDANNPPGYQVADDAYTACICQTPGVCAQACGGSLCAGQNPSGQCQQCMNSQKAWQCDDAAGMACQASPACTASDQCFEQSGCDQKP